MKTFTLIKELRSFLAPFRGKKGGIGFVPTMGALHAGHIALVKQCKSENELCVASIFVNPTQFNDKRDLEKYPRTLQKDAEMLEKAGCDVVFVPEVEEMYPKSSQESGVRSGESDNKWQLVDLGNLDKVMEGAQRPGHFKGVIQVVSKLFDIVEPDRAYFGQKDFQQLAVIREMVKQLKYPVQIIACPTIRESDGLAMSSRNTRLTEAERKAAPLIAKTLYRMKELAQTLSVSDLKKMALEELKKEKLFETEYVEISDTRTLQPLNGSQRAQDAVACVALKLGSVRLIDNVLLP